MKKTAQVIKPTRTISGVAPVTIFTKPYSCTGNCIFCPTEKDIPKSYLSDEPGIQRATALKYNPYTQIQRRIEILEENGHNVSKVELIISGGTWDDYPLEYRLRFILAVFTAFNDLEHKKKSSSWEEIKEKDLNRETLWEKIYKQQDINSHSKHRCIGMSIETRPDKINLNSIEDLRQLGVTKVQLGIQSLNNEILNKNNRGHTREDIFSAINLLRRNGFKIQIHWMCNLYSSNPKLDYNDFKELFNNPNVKPDEMKIYPCSLVSGTVLNKLYQEGKYQPYSTKQLIDLLIKCKQEIPEYCRINRIFRDIPSNLIVAGHKKTNLRQMIWQEMDKRNLECNCIRCREIRKEKVDSKPKLSIEKYETKVSTEYFLQYLIDNRKIVGFLRLAIYNKGVNVQLLHADAMIREIHVYGRALAIGKHKKGRGQHQGYGTKLIKKAEKIVQDNGGKSLAVIASVGTREYYKKKGFQIIPKMGYGLKDFFRHFLSTGIHS